MNDKTSFHTRATASVAAALALVAYAPDAGAAAQERVSALDAQALDWFGYDVATNGDYTVVGAYRDDDSGESTGSAHVLYTPGTQAPTYVQKLTLGTMSAGDRAGLNVAIGGDIVAVSAPGKVLMRSDGTSVTGTVAVFERAASGLWVEVAELDAPDRSEGDLFGESVAVTASGMLLVGAPRDDDAAPDGGAVHVFERDTAGWVRSAKLAPNDCGTHDYFGHDIATSGTDAVVTAYNDDDRGVNAGAAYTLRLANGVWGFEQKLTAAEGANFDLFGTCAAMHGNTIVIGAPQNEDTDDDARVNEGLCVIYERPGRNKPWAETFVLRPGKPADEHRFGIDVAINDHVIVVGASHSDSGLLNSGAAHLFCRRARDWFEAQRHQAAAPEAYDYLGLSVAAGDNAVIIGVPGANELRTTGPIVGCGAVEVLNEDGQLTTWGSTYCHEKTEVSGFRKMGGMRNSTGGPGRLCPVGSPSLSRDDMILRATGLPPGDLASLFVGGASTNISVQASKFCVAGGSVGRYRFPYEIVGPSGRYIVRRPLGRIEDSYPGTTSALVGVNLFAQVAYYNQNTREWLTTNALRFKPTN